MLTFNTDMAAAPRDETLIGVVLDPSDPADPFELELIWWNEALRRWDGDYRCVDESVLAQRDPIAWARTPEIDEGLITLAAAARVVPGSGVDARS